MPPVAPRCRPEPGSWPTPTPPTKTSNATTRPGRSSPRPPRPGTCGPVRSRPRHGDTMSFPTPLAIAYESAAAVASDLGVSVAADYGDPAAEEAAFTDGAALVDRCARGAVLVNGPDTITFLQSLLSQDIVDLADGQGVHALLLHPQGKL